VVLAILSVPVVAAAIGAVNFYVSNADNRTLIVQGVKRGYVLYVPKTYDRRKPTPLILSFHGAGLWGAAQRDISRLNVAADRYGFIVAYPSAAGGDGPKVWHVEPGADTTNDVRFVDRVIDTLRAQYNVDARRVYANGLSNGGGMSFVLSCTLSDRIAAVGLVASAQTLEWKWCTDSTAVPMVSFHGTADRQAPYNGGASWVSLGQRVFPSMHTWTANWARRNRCAATPVESRVARDVTRREYTRCADDASVVLYTIEGGGHTWPGGDDAPEQFLGPVNRTIDADSVMWQFFLAHPLRRGR
jgi:polyhydroxybutyrate depolymerase